MPHPCTKQFGIYILSHNLRMGPLLQHSNLSPSLHHIPRSSMTRISTDEAYVKRKKGNISHELMHDVMTSLHLSARGSPPLLPRPAQKYDLEERQK